MKHNSNTESKGGSPVKFIHVPLLFRKIILYTQYALVITVLTMAVMLYTGSLDYRKVSLFFAMISLLTGCVIYVACTSPDINYMKKTFSTWGALGLLASIGSALVFWKIFSPEAWYYFNLIIIIGVCLSLFTETEKLNRRDSDMRRNRKRSILQVVAGIIILFDLVGILVHALGWLDLKLPLLILMGATFILVLMVIISIARSGKENTEISSN